ncbi:MAG: DMT family transporter [Acidobacteria bacterium]|nr:DMT family transporter [Acidobacteriota bacterium]
MTTQIASSLRTVLLTAVTMTFFAANSLLARFALREGEIDGGSFTAVRIFAGAVALVLLVAVRRGGLAALRGNGSVGAALALFGYAITFSFAYLSLDAGVGALILFAAVQITMIAVGIVRGEQPGPSEWIGLTLAFGGLVYLVSPGLTAPSPAGVTLMAASGAAWGCYSLAAKGVRSPIAATAGNFARAAPMAAGALVVIWWTGQPHASWTGLRLAAISGAFTSGLGYAIWYITLKDLSTTRAAIVQLTVPVLAAAAGVILLGEQMTLRLVLASAAILGGVALALLGKNGVVSSAHE